MLDFFFSNQPFFTRIYKAQGRVWASQAAGCTLYLFLEHRSDSRKWRWICLQESSNDNNFEDFRVDMANFSTIQWQIHVIHDKWLRHVQCSGLGNKIWGQRTDGLKKTQYWKICWNGQSRDWLMTNYFSPFEKLSVWDWKLKPILIPACLIL